MVRYLAKLCFCIILCSPCFPQQAKQYSFTHFTSANGLASNFVNRIAQDPFGYIWIATINGLQRYDGKRFFSFRNEKDNPNTIPTPEVVDIKFDRHGLLWIFTRDNKVGTFDYRKFIYKEYPVRVHRTLKNYITKKLIELPDGDLVLFVEGEGFFRLDTKTNIFKPDDHLFNAPKNWRIRSVQYDQPIDRYWLTCDSGLVLHNANTGENSYRGHNVENDAMIKKCSEANTFIFWINKERRAVYATWPANEIAPTFHVFDYKTNQAKKYILSDHIGTGYHEIYGTMEQRNGRLWIFGLPFIVEYTGGAKPFDVVRNEYYGEQSIKIDKVECMFEDNQQNIWIASTNGIFLFNPDRQIFNTYTLLRPGAKVGIEGNVQATLETFPSGDIWIGCWGQGLYFYDKNFRPIAGPESLRKYRDYASVWGMWQHSRTGKVWICLQGGELLVYDPKTGRTDRVAPQAFQGKTIRQVTEDKEGNLWFGTQRGALVRWSLKESGGSIKDGYSVMWTMGRIQRLFTDKQGYIWVAALNDALYRIDPVNASIALKIGGPGTGPLSYSGESVNDVHQYNDSLFVIACGPIDILNINNNTIEHISTLDGLPSNSVVCLQSDAGVLWLAMLNGLARMNLEKKIFTFYDRRDGLSTDNFVVAGSNKLRDGKIVLNTDHNFIVFDSKNLLQNDAPPDVRITDFLLDNKSLSVDSLLNESRLHLSHDNNAIAIEFSSMSYNKQNKIIYYYMLEGLDKKWIQADDRQQAIYNYLKPGRYTFRIKCQNGDGVPSRNVTILNIYVSAPFYQSWWFYCLVALTILGILYWTDRGRVRKLVALQQVRSQIADNLHEDVNTTLGNINLLSELARIKVDKDIDKSKEFIDQINEKSKRMIEAMDDMLWSIQPENDSMQKTLDRMNQHAQGLQFTHGFKFQMLIDEQVKSLKLDMNIRHEIFLIYKEAIGNVARHSSARNVVVNIDIDRSSLWMKIQDDGRGFSVAAVERSRGIKEMRKRAMHLKGDLDIQSDRLGTSILLKIPV
ncbi:MAG TPA: two-component regulator propeller domain-containing protein [Flavitalea sp.]|nr:two-component regulator propeller domain-containing protein [Flavitalea sp.]